MPKRNIWILFFIAPFAIIILAVWHTYTKIPFGITKTDLSASQVRNAVAALERERLKWAGIHEVSAHVHLESGTETDWSQGKTQVLDCDVHLEQSDRIKDQAPWFFPVQMIASNTAEGWIVRTDGTPQNTKAESEHGSKLQKDKLPYIGMLPGFLLWPQHVLLPWVSDSIYPVSPGLLLNCSIRRGTNTTSPNYIFKSGDGRMNEVTFDNGYLIAQHIGNKMDENFFVEDTVRINGVLYPSVLSYVGENLKLKVTISDLEVGPR